MGRRESARNDPKRNARVPADLAELLMQDSKLGSPLWTPARALTVAEVCSAVEPAIVTSIQGGDPRAAVNRAAADAKRIVVEIEKR